MLLAVCKILRYGETVTSSNFLAHFLQVPNSIVLKIKKNSCLKLLQLKFFIKTVFLKVHLILLLVVCN